MENIKTIILGNEFDSELLEKIKHFFMREKLIVNSDDWALAGSQDYQLITFEYLNHKIDLEIETYIGISITGEQTKVEAIRKALM